MPKTQLELSFSSICKAIKTFIYDKYFKNVLKRNVERLILAFRFSVDPLERHTFWSCLTGNTIVWLAVFGANQTMVQRYMTAPSLSKAKKSHFTSYLIY
jgi:hypothetical protein